MSRGMLLVPAVAVLLLITLAEKLRGTHFLFLDVAAFGPQIIYFKRLEQLIFRNNRGLNRKSKTLVVFSSTQADPALTRRFIDFLHHNEVGVIDLRNFRGAMSYFVSALLRLRGALLVRSQVDLRFPSLLGKNHHLVLERLQNAFVSTPSSWLTFQCSDYEEIFRKLNIQFSDQWLCISYRESWYKSNLGDSGGRKKILKIEEDQRFRNTPLLDLGLAIAKVADSGLKAIIFTEDLADFENAKSNFDRNVIIVPPSLSQSTAFRAYVYKQAIGALHGGVGGAADLPWLLRIPLAIVNWFPYSGLAGPQQFEARILNPWLLRNGDVSHPLQLSNTLVAPQVFHAKNHDSNASFRRDCFPSLYAQSLIDRAGIALRRNTKEEIKGVATDFLSYLESGLPEMNTFFAGVAQDAWRNFLSYVPMQPRLGQGNFLGEIWRWKSSSGDSPPLLYTNLSPSFFESNQQFFLNAWRPGGPK